jgi:formyltetrahydrofolate deformylase
MAEAAKHIILLISCPDRVGIVAAVSSFLADRQCFIDESNHFGDPSTGRFFMRTRCQLPTGITLEQLRAEFSIIAEKFQMDATLHDSAQKMRTLIMVSKIEHCLNDLLHRMRIGALAIDVPLVISNHESLRSLVEWHGIRYEYLPSTPTNKEEREATMFVLAAEYNIELVVLARYMQILSPALAAKFSGRAINIHHSFLPSFKGARPYEQAYSRGVKLIGATAHYVTSDLDEGPIIEQDVERVSHDNDPARLAAVGHDIERVVLARAVRAHVEHRVLLNGEKTVVFS